MIGRTISHYRIVDELGAGGMGVVYRARDTLLERFVALKLLPPDAVADESRQRRFLQEARAASALNHPNIVTIHDVLHDEGTHAIVMELVDGVSLQKRLQDGPLPTTQALTIARQIADALSAAHGAGIVHRDLKPANVMLTERGQVKVLDFGIAKLDPARTGTDDGTRTAAVTIAGAILGTAAYMSPEQACGEPVDARTDVFSIGVLTYEMLSGRSPFAAATITAVLHKLIYEEPAELSSLRADLPPGVAAMIQRAMAKKPADRYQSMDTFISVLDDVATGRMASPATSAADRPTHRGRNWRRPALAAVLLVVLIGGAAFGARKFGWRPFAGSAPTDSLETTLPSTPFAAYDRGQQLLERYDRDGYLDESIRSFRHAIDLRNEYPAAYAGLGMAYWRKYREQRDPMWLDYAATNAKHAVELDAQLTIGLVALAYASIERGELPQAEQLLIDALTRDPQNADALAARAYLRLQQRNVPAAIESVRQAIAIQPEDWSLSLMEGVILMTAGRSSEAVAPLERASKLVPDSALALRNLGAAYYAVNRYPEATTVFQQALRIKPDPAVYNNLGTVFFYRGLYDQAVNAFDRAVKLRPNDFRTWANLGDAYRLIPGRSSDATKAYTRGLQLIDEQLAKSPASLDLITRRVIMLAKSGNCGDASAKVAALDLARASATEQYRIAVADEVCGNRDRALDRLTKSIAAGYGIDQVKQDPELARLRDDVRFHEFLAARQTAGPNVPKR